TPTTVDETIYTTSADTGSSYRISDCQYVYNLAASPLGNGHYQIGINLSGVEIGTAAFFLK
ncbi:MAG: hypothetical protein J2P16_00350, partial [Mycobacterium sp.]|nr:hypothetical protein [Mycobacterium sp.]